MANTPVERKLEEVLDAIDTILEDCNEVLASKGKPPIRVIADLPDAVEGGIESSALVDTDKGLGIEVIEEEEYIYVKVDNSTIKFNDNGQLYANISGLEILTVSELPTASASTMGKLYLVPSASSKTQNVKDEYITIQSSSSYDWEQIGSTEIDLTDYATKAWVEAKGYALDSDLADVAKSGNYEDLINTPTIPTETPIATTSVAGKVKPDGTTITVDSNGEIKAPYTSIDITNRFNTIFGDNTPPVQPEYPPVKTNYVLPSSNLPMVSGYDIVFPIFTVDTNGHPYYYEVYFDVPAGVIIHGICFARDWSDSFALIVSNTNSSNVNIDHIYFDKYNATTGNKEITKGSLSSLNGQSTIDANASQLCLGIYDKGQFRLYNTEYYLNVNNIPLITTGTYRNTTQWTGQTTAIPINNNWIYTINAGSTDSTPWQTLQDEVTTLESNKQDLLTAGENITIDENNVISATGGGSITVDDTLSMTSENPVQNKIITNAISPLIPPIIQDNIVNMSTPDAKDPPYDVAKTMHNWAIFNVFGKDNTNYHNIQFAYTILESEIDVTDNFDLMIKIVPKSNYYSYQPFFKSKDGQTHSVVVYFVMEQINQNGQQSGQGYWNKNQVITQNITFNGTYKVLADVWFTEFGPSQSIGVNICKDNNYSNIDYEMSVREDLLESVNIVTNYTFTYNGSIKAYSDYTDVKNRLSSIECKETTDGTYILQATVTDGEVIYEWVPTTSVIGTRLIIGG